MEAETIDGDPDGAEGAPPAAEPYQALRAKQPVVDDASGKRISHINFGTFSKAEIERSSEFEVITNKGYEQPSRTPIRGARG